MVFLDDGEEEGLRELYEEAKMPIEDIISKYAKKGIDIKRIPISQIEDQPCASTSSSSSMLNSSSMCEPICFYQKMLISRFLIYLI